MATPAEKKEARAKGWQKPDLIGVWNDIKAKKKITGFPPGKALEYLIIRSFDIDGIKVRWPYDIATPQKVGTVEQVDGFVHLGDRGFIVEAKDLASPVSIETVAKLRFRLESRPPGTMGLIFSMKDYTSPAELLTQFAMPRNIILWGRDDIDYGISADRMKIGLEKKIDFILEYGLPWLLLNNKVAP
jgi:hypothetical protein